MENYNSEILALEKIEIDVTFSAERNRQISGHNKNFYVVPTEMIINGSRDLWKHCPPLVNFDVMDCHNEIVANGQYPYNSIVGQLFCDKHNPDAVYEEHSFLSAIVYCTSSYISCIKDEICAKAFHEKATSEGYIQATENILKEAAGTKRKFIVIRNGQNVLGEDVKIIKQDKLLLKDWGERGLHWMKPRASKTGYRATIGQYIKEAI